MSDMILNADQKSAFVLASTEPSKVEIPAYGLPKGTPMLYYDYFASPCQNPVQKDVQIFDKEVTAKLPRTSFWSDAMHRCIIKFKNLPEAGTGEVTGNSLGAIGLRNRDVIYTSYSLSNYTQTVETTLTTYQDLPLEHKLAVWTRSQLLKYDSEEPVGTGPVLNDTAYVTYTPCFHPSVYNVRNNWFVGILEPLNVKSKFTSARKIGLLPNVQVFFNNGDINDDTLFTKHTTYDPETTAKLQLSNFGGLEGQSMPYFSYDSEVQVVPLTSNTSTKVIMTTSFVTYLTSVFIRGSGNATKTGTPQFTRINGLDVNLGNKPYITDISQKFVSYGVDKVSGGSFNIKTIASGTDSVFALDDDNNKLSIVPWCENVNKRTYFSGGIALEGVVNPQMVLKYLLTGADDEFKKYEAVLTNLFYQMLLMNGKTGRISKSIAS